MLRRGLILSLALLVAACGGGVEGVALYTEKITAELQEAMKMTGCATLEDITYDKVRICK